jgi:hypothetical protein
MMALQPRLLGLWLAAWLLSLWPLLGPDLPQGHDLLFEVVRAAEFHRAVDSGAWRPRWATNLLGGYGYPIFDFFPPLLLTLTAAAASLGLTLSLAYKVALGLVAVAGVAGTARLGLMLGGPTLQGLLPLLYASSPYAWHDLAVRNAWSEWTGLQLAPLTLACGVAVVQQAGPRPVLLFGVAAALQLLAHNLSLLLWLPVWLCGVAVVLVGRQTAGPTVASALGKLVLGSVVALGLAATFWLPLLAEVQYVGLQWQDSGPFSAGANLLDLAQLLTAEWLPMALVGLSGLLSAVVLAGLQPQHRGLWVALAGLLGLLLLLPLQPFAPVWQVLRPLQWLMFPWRLFAPAGLLAALACGALAVALVQASAHKWLAAVPLGAGLAGWLLLPAVPRADLLPLADNLPAMRRGFATTTVMDEYLPKTVQIQPTVPADEPAASGVSGAVLRCSPPDQRDVTCSIHLPQAGEVVIRRLWFPGWQLAVDGQAVAPRISKRGTPVLELAAGDHHLAVTLLKTPVQRAADAVSLASLCGLAAGAWRIRRRYKPVPA